MTVNIANLIISENVFKNENDEMLIYRPLSEAYLEDLNKKVTLYITIALINMDSRPSHRFSLSILKEGKLIWGDKFTVERKDEFFNKLVDENDIILTALASDLTLPGEGLYEVALNEMNTKESKSIHFKVTEGIRPTSEYEGLDNE